MSTIALPLPADGQTIEAADVNTPFNTIAAAINGGLDSTNITAAGVSDASLIYGKLRSRQGGSATDWSSGSTTTFDTSGTNVFMQAGAQLVAGTTGTDLTITFPTAFTYIPLILVSTASAGSNAVTFSVNTQSTTSFKVRIIFTGGGSASENVNWLAIGQ